jgi:hypothetical protein
MFSKTKAPPEVAAKKKATDMVLIGIYEEEFGELDFNDDKNIIFIK